METLKTTEIKLNKAITLPVLRNTMDVAAGDSLQVLWPQDKKRGDMEELRDAPSKRVKKT